MKPIVIVAAGQSNMVGWTGTTNGPFFDVPDVHIWDTGVDAFRGGSGEPVNLATREYQVYSAYTGTGPKTIGDHRNNLAVAFAYRLAQETGRKVYVVFNCSGSRNSLYWIGNGRLSVDWQALNADLAAALASIGASEIDYFLWQQGEADADDGDPAGTYRSELGTLRTQAMAETWWGDETVMLIGKPCQQWNQTAYLNYLNAEIDAFGAIGHDNVGIAESKSPYFANSPYLGVSTDTIHFTGRSLYSLGYYSYWNAIPDWKMPDKKTFTELWDERPYSESAYPPGEPTVSYVSHLATASKYNLAPSITKTGSRFWMGWTANPVNASEGDGTLCKLAWTDNNFVSVNGVTVGGSGVGFMGFNAAEPCLWAAPDGSLWCFMMSSTVPSQVFDGTAGVWLSVCRNPTAASPRFSKPRMVSKRGWCQPPVRFEGKWYLPVSYWRLPQGSGYPSFVPALAGRYLLEIDWVNVALKMGITISQETADSTFDEQNITQLISGRLRASWRTLNGPVYSDSTDYHGGSWGTPAAFADLGTGRPASRHRTATSPTGRFLCAWCDATGRSNLTLGASDLGAQSSVSTYKVVLDAGASAYPDIYADGTDIYVIYDNANRETVAGGGSGGRIRVAKVNEAALAAGTAAPTVYPIDA